jgi:hypothetical protein
VAQSHADCDQYHLVRQRGHLGDVLLRHCHAVGMASCRPESLLQGLCCSRRLSKGPPIPHQKRRRRCSQGLCSLSLLPLPLCCSCC